MYFEKCNFRFSKIKTLSFRISRATTAEQRHYYDDVWTYMYDYVKPSDEYIYTYVYLHY